MISSEHVRTLAAYNAVMNRDLFAVASTLDDAARRADRGAYWGSIHGTLCHLLWGDHMWMMRFDGWDRPSVGIKGSADWIKAFDALAAARMETDRRLSDWADTVTPAWLASDLSWTSGATGKDYTYPRWFLVTHLFNHQTHHRGQVHALLTAAGTTPGDTDLPFLVTPAA